MSRFSIDKGWGANEGITVIFARSAGTRYAIGGRDDPAEAEAIAAHFNDVLANGLDGCAQLAQRDGELEALRGKVGDAVAGSAWAVCPFCGFLNCPYDRKPSADDHKESCPWRPVFAALSDSQEGQDG